MLPRDSKSGRRPPFKIAFTRRDFIHHSATKRSVGNPPCNGDVVNQYGITTSPLQGGLPTDRLVAEWWMKSRRVNAILNGGRRPDFESLGSIAVPAEI